jgi:hypothetical protein
MAMVAAVILMMPGTAQAEERSWREVPLPTLWPKFGITQVAGAGPNEAWIAGYEGQQCIDVWWPRGGKVCSGNAIVRKWNGTRWENKNPLGLLAPFIIDLQASSPTNVWVVGANDFLLRWDGTRWSRAATPPGCSGVGQIHPVGADELWATFGSATTAGHTCVARWKAGTWQVHMFTTWVHHIGSTGPGEIVIDALDTDTKPQTTYRYTGSTWESLPIPPSHPDLKLTSPGARYYGTCCKEDLLKVTTAGTETIPAPPDGARYKLVDDLGRLWAHNDDTLYRYDGTAWQTVPTGLTLSPISDWTSAPNSQGALWAITGTIDSNGPYHILTNG